MGKKSFSFLFVFFIIFLFAQSKIKVIDKETGNPIPYAKIILNSGNSYINTEENGTAEIKSNQNISEIQAFGFENFKVEKFQNVFPLHPKFKNIEEVGILRPKNKTRITLGEIKKEFPSSGFGSANVNWTVVDFFNLKESNKGQLFIKKIRFLSLVRKTSKPAKINLVFYKNENGLPSSEIWKNYVVTCEKGKNITEMNFEKAPIIFPNEGLFIGFEWIISDENTYKEKGTYYHKDGAKEKKIVEKLNPKLFSQKSTTETIFVKNKSNWINYNKIKFENEENKELSIEIELTD